MWRRASLFTLLYVAISLGIEGSLIILGGLRVPQDNATIAPIILTLPPIFAALLAGYRRRREFIVIVILTAVLTQAITLLYIRLTGISTGLIEPLINRSLAGFLAATITNRAERTSRD
jgi:hypothetical protein